MTVHWEVEADQRNKKRQCANANDPVHANQGTEHGAKRSAPCSVSVWGVWDSTSELDVVTSLSDGLACEGLLVSWPVATLFCAISCSTSTLCRCCFATACFCLSLRTAHSSSMPQSPS